MSELRIFSYLPNPRIWKATIAARLCGVELDVRGAAPEALQDWLWDFDAHAMSDDQRAVAAAWQREAKTGFSSRLFKTDAFLKAHPFGTVPAAFSPDGAIGIFESNSIMRNVARLGAERTPLYGRDPYTASRIDSFLDASLVFARDTQLYVLGLRSGGITADVHGSAARAFAHYMGGIDAALAQTGDCIVEGGLSLADICFVAELALLHHERRFRGLLESAGLLPILGPRIADNYPHAMRHFSHLSAHEAFAPDVAPFLRELL